MFIGYIGFLYGYPNNGLYCILLGLFGRGLKTRLLANGMQGLLFSVLYRHFMELQERRRRERGD